MPSRDATASKLQTLGAISVSIAVFAVLLNIVSPVVEHVLEQVVLPLFKWFGRYFVPERYGGGIEVDNPGLLKESVDRLWRFAVLSTLSAFGGLKSGLLLFTNTYKTVVLTVFGGAVVAWATFTAYTTFAEQGLLLAGLFVAIAAFPPLLVAYLIQTDVL
jgi:hypothetical protein